MARLVLYYVCPKRRVIAPSRERWRFFSGKGKFTDLDVVEALDLVFRFSRDKLFSPGVFGSDFANAQSEFQTGKACFYLFHDSIAKGLHDAEGEQLKLDFMLMPNLVKKSVISQFPGGPGLVMAIPARIDADRKEAALRLIDFLSSDDINRESMQINGGAVPVNANVQPSDLPFYQKEKTEISKMVTYLDWFYPPEITTTLQEGLQVRFSRSDNRGRALQKSASAAGAARRAAATILPDKAGVSGSCADANPFVQMPGRERVFGQARLVGNAFRPGNAAL